MNYIKINPETFNPYGNTLLVRVGRKQAQEKKTDTGIIITPASNTSMFDRETGGEVVQIGKDVEDIKVNDIVWYDLHAGIDAEDTEGNTYVVLRTENIIGFERKI